MGEIINFPQKNNNEEVPRFYSFGINYENYLLLCYDDRNEVQYAGSEITEDEEVIPVTITHDEAKMLFETTYPTFFIDVSNEIDNTKDERYVAMLYFDFEGKRYALYYHETKEDLPLLLFLIENNDIVKLEDEFTIKRIVKFVDDNFEIDLL